MPTRQDLGGWASRCAFRLVFVPETVILRTVPAAWPMARYSSRRSALSSAPYPDTTDFQPSDVSKSRVSICRGGWLPLNSGMVACRHVRR